jgi:hypothetical protein
MSENEKISVAALISVILRRKVGRTIDVQWLIKDATYAREIINLSRNQGLDDLTSYANKLEALFFDNSAANTVAKPSVAEVNKAIVGMKTILEEEPEEEFDETKVDLSKKYIGHLR